MEVVYLNQKQLAARRHLSEASLERWRSEDIGPIYMMMMGRVRYRLFDITDFEEDSGSRTSWVFEGDACQLIPCDSSSVIRRSFSAWSLATSDTSSIELPRSYGASAMCYLEKKHQGCAQILHSLFQRRGCQLIAIDEGCPLNELLSIARELRAQTNRYPWRLSCTAAT